MKNGFANKLKKSLNETRSRYFIQEAQKLNRPQYGAFAVDFHQWSNSQTVPEHLARKTMLRAGYEPFMGYPLVRKEKAC